MSTVSEAGHTGGGWNAEDYACNARFVADLATPLIELLDPQPGERILDLGCGDGVLSAAIAERGADVVGVDASTDLACASRERGVHTLVADGQTLDACLALEGRFDAVFSNAAMHWMARDPQAVIAGVHQRLVPGGRFVAEFGGAGNIAPIHAALRAQAQARGLDPDTIDPWYFPTEDEYRQRLVKGGFSVEQIRCFDRQTELPGDISLWLTTLARPFVDAFDAGQPRDDYVAAVRGRLVEALQDARGRWSAPYRRLRFVARRAHAC